MPLEDNIADALFPTINAITETRKPMGTRTGVAIDGENEEVETHDGKKLRPGIFVWANDLEYFPRPPKIPSKMGKDAGKDVIDYRWCLIPIEVKTERTRGNSLRDEEKIRLAPIDSAHRYGHIDVIFRLSCLLNVSWNYIFGTVQELWT